MCIRDRVLGLNFVKTNTIRFFTFSDLFSRGTWKIINHVFKSSFLSFFNSPGFFQRYFIIDSLMTNLIFVFAKIPTLHRSHVERRKLLNRKRKEEESFRGVHSIWRLLYPQSPLHWLSIGIRGSYVSLILPGWPSRSIGLPLDTKETKRPNQIGSRMSEGQ